MLTFTLNANTIAMTAAKVVVVMMVVIVLAREVAVVSLLPSS